MKLRFISLLQIRPSSLETWKIEYLIENQPEISSVLIVYIDRSWIVLNN